MWEFSCRGEPLLKEVDFHIFTFSHFHTILPLGQWISSPERWQVMPSDVLVLGYKLKSGRHKRSPWHVQGALRGVLPSQVQVSRLCLILLGWNSQGFRGSGCLRGSSSLQHSCRCIPKGRTQSKGKLRLQGCSPPSLDLPVSFLLFTFPTAPPKCSSYPPLVGIQILGI